MTYNSDISYNRKERVLYDPVPKGVSKIQQVRVKTPKFT